jgi:FkbM family methyltransferase
MLVATSAGKFWIPASDLWALTAELAEQQTGVHGNEIHPGDIVLDCGANVGVYTRAALDQGAKVVVAIDLAARPLACLRRTFEHEIQEGRVIVYPKGVWDRDTTLRMSVNTATTDNSVALNRGEEGPEVPLTTIDRLVSELKLPRVDFIEMDIEGAESHALQGAAHTIAVYKPRLAISMEHKQSDPEEIPALIQRLNSQYQMRCGICGYTTGRLQPEEIFAW